MGGTQSTLKVIIMHTHTSIFPWMIGENLQSAKEETCLGHPSPVASTGISSYFSKLIPVLVLANSSLEIIHNHQDTNIIHQDTAIQ